MALEHYQDIRRCVVVPTYTSAEPSEQIGVLQRSYSQLAQEVITCHNRVFSVQPLIPALAANAIIILPAPFPDTNYSPIVTLGWNAYAWISAITASQFTVTFSAVAPAITGGTLYAIIIR